MKTKLILIALLITCSLNAQDRKHTVYWTTSFAFYDYFYQKDRTVKQDNNGLMLSMAIDPRMAMDSVKLDRTLYLGYKIGRFEPQINWERFSNLGFDKYSMGLNYCVVNRKLALIVGYEFGYTDNKIGVLNESKHWKVWSRYGVNLESRLKMNENFYLSLETNVAESPDVPSKIVRHNARIKLTYIL